MKLTEFKAWFEGYTESMTAPPNEKQWERIKARIAEIDGQPVVREVFVDRYVRPYYERWIPYYGTVTAASSGTSYPSSNVTLLSAGSHMSGVEDIKCAWRDKADEAFDSYDAMGALGRMEFASSQ